MTLAELFQTFAWGLTHGYAFSNIAGTPDLSSRLGFNNATLQIENVQVGQNYTPGQAPSLDHPAGGVSYMDTLAFMNMKNEMEGLPVKYYQDVNDNDIVDAGDLPYKGDGINGTVVPNSIAMTDAGLPGYYMPDSAQWKVAAKGNTVSSSGTLFPWGNTAADSSYANFNSSDTVRVASYPKGLGIHAPCYDLAGNVAEWVFLLNRTSGYSLARNHHGGNYSSPDSDALKSQQQTASVATDRLNTLGIRVIKR